MTANQLQNAMNMETQRHNLAIEQIDEGANAINARKVELENEWHRESNRIQEEYNQKYLLMQQSQGDTKLALQAQLNEVEAYKVRVDEEYKHRMARVNEEANALKQQSIFEDVRHNTQSENIGRYSSETERKRVEYQKHQWDTENALAYSNYELNSLRESHSYTLGLYDAGLRMYGTLDQMVRTKQANNKLLVDLGLGIANAASNILRLPQLGGR